MRLRSPRTVVQPLLIALCGALLPACNQGPTAHPPGPHDSGGATDTAVDRGADSGPDLHPADVAGDPTPDLADEDLSADVPLPDLDPEDVPTPDDPTPDETTDAVADATPDETPDVPLDEVMADAEVDAPVCDPHEIPTGSPRIVVGTGLTAYEPLEGCQRVPIILGPQGGAHVWGAFRAAGFDATGITFDIDFTLTQDGNVVAAADYQDALPPTAGEYEYASVLVQLPEGTAPEDIAEHRSTLTVHLFEEGVVDVTDSVEIIPYCCEF